MEVSLDISQLSFIIMSVKEDSVEDCWLQSMWTKRKNT